MEENDLMHLPVMIRNKILEARAKESNMMLYTGKPNLIDQIRYFMKRLFL